MARAEQDGIGRMRDRNASYDVRIAESADRLV
jgi:hypothetical protein